MNFGHIVGYKNFLKVTLEGEMAGKQPRGWTRVMMVDDIYMIAACIDGKFV